MRCDAAIAKVEAWARWEMGAGSDGAGSDGSGKGIAVSRPDHIPGDMADYMTVEIALKEFGRKEPAYLRELLKHIYRPDGGGVESFVEVRSELEQARPTLRGYGIEPHQLCSIAVRRFVRFLDRRLSVGEAA